MANEEQLTVLRQGVKVWNKWREDNQDTKPELTHASLDGNLSEIDLHETNLALANLDGANLSKANLSRANLFRANLEGANLSKANLSKADLSWANLSWADLHEADLRDTDLQASTLINTDLTKANLSGSIIFGISAWNLKLEGTIQSDLIVETDPVVTVDNLEIAQFIYLLLHNEKIRDVIDTIGKKAVLILGRFSPERKAVLDTLRAELRKRNYTPILFDFEKSAGRDLTETIVTLAHLSRFIIADITDAKSIPQELQAIVPNLPSVAVQPIILSSEHEYAMFEHFKRYPWVLPVYQYDTQEQLLSALTEKVIQPAEAKVKELRSSS